MDTHHMKDMHHMMDTHHKLPDIRNFHFHFHIIVTMVISNKSCCKHVLFMNLSDFLSTATRVTSVRYKKFLLGFGFGVAPADVWSKS